MSPPPWARAVVAGLLGAVGALALLGPLSALTGDVGPGRVELRADWDPAHRTDLVVPPLGRVSADTHAGPVQLTARIRTIDIGAVRSLADETDPGGRLTADVQDDLRPLLWRFGLRATALAAVVGALVAALPPWRRWPHLPAGAAGGALAVGALLGTSALTYDPLAFEQPRFEGALAEAPRIIETVRRNVEGFDDVRSRIDVLGGQIGDLYATSVTDELAGSPEEVRLLHVSDIHLNPVGLEVAAELAERFAVDAVLDTGDLTTFGLPFESRIGELVADLPVPYLVVPGNHDSPRNRRALGQLPDVTVLDGDLVEVAGLRIAGVGDPTFTATNEVDDEEVAAAIADQQPEVDALVANRRPDVLAVHNPRQADLALGAVPLVVAGHVHEHTVELVGDTVVTTAGSTGATGLGSFTVDTDLPYEASVLRFVDGRLRGIDAVSLRGTEGEFTLDRRIFPPTT